MGEGESKPTTNPQETIDSLRQQCTTRYNGLQEERQNFKEKAEQLNLDGFLEYYAILKTYIIDTIELITQLQTLSVTEFDDAKNDLEDMLIALNGSQNVQCKTNINHECINTITFDRQNELQLKLRNDIDNEISAFSEFLKTHSKEESDKEYYVFGKHVKEYLCHYTREYQPNTSTYEFAWNSEEETIEKLFKRMCVGYRPPCSLRMAGNASDELNK